MSSTLQAIGDYISIFFMHTFAHVIVYNNMLYSIRVCIILIDILKRNGIRRPKHSLSFL